MPSQPVSPRPPNPRVGLCETCRHRQEVRNTRGSTFWLCVLSRQDPAYPRYPRLPVLSCAGYRSAAERRRSAAEPDRSAAEPD
ncbi:MAG TPA: hypothetical protein VLJ42_05230 [Solirubrobacteraceae bacterium]|nr:hypothetical protein [Solirubrobacteraceae bacterium]